MLEVVKKLGEISVLKYKKIFEDNEDDIDLYSFEDENINEDSDEIIDEDSYEIIDDYDIDGEILMLEEYIIGYTRGVEIGFFPISKIKALIYYLEQSCIFNEKEIVKWINEYSEEFPKFFDYMLSVENLREAFVYHLKNIELPKLTKKDPITNLEYRLKLNSNNCNKYIKSISNLDISKVEVTNYYKYYHDGENIINTKFPNGASYYWLGDDNQIHIESSITLTCEDITDNFILEEYIIKACIAIKADISSNNKTLKDEIPLFKDVKSLCNNDIFPANVEELKKEFYMLFNGRGDIEAISNLYFSKIDEFAYIGEPIFHDEIYSYDVTFFFISNNKFYFVNYVSKHYAT